MSLSTLRLRYALLIPNFAPFLNWKLHSHSQPTKPCKVSAFHHGNVEDVVQSFNGILNLHPPPPIIEFNKILGSLMKMKRYPTTISLFKQIQVHEITPDTFTLNILINCYCHMGPNYLPFAFSVLAMIHKLGYHPDTVTLNTLMKGVCFNGEVNHALQFYNNVAAQGYQLNEVSYGILIDGICKMGQTGTAIELLRKIEGQVKPDVVMYSSIINSLCKDKLVMEAHEFHLEMVEKGVSPDNVTYTTLIYGLCLVGQLKEAIDLLNEMVLKSIIPNVYTFNTLIDGLCKERNVKQAKNVLALMIKEGLRPNIVTYNCLMNGCCLANEVKKAKVVFDTIARMGVTPDVQSYTIMIKGFCKIKMVDEALSLFEEMLCKNINPDIITYNSLIDGLCKSGGISYAWDFVNGMHEKGQPADINTYNSLLDVCRNHNVDKATALLKKIEDQGIQPDLCTYTILIDGLCKGGRFKTAKEIFHHFLMKGHHLDVRMCNVMINGFCKEGLIDEALALKSKMEENDCLPNVITFETIIRALFSNKRNDKAEKLLREMRARGLL